MPKEEGSYGGQDDREWLYSRVGKRERLEEVSFLGLSSIDLYKVDLSQLVGGKPFTLPCTISQNRLGIKTRTLINTGANGFIFIDSRLVEKAS